MKNNANKQIKKAMLHANKSKNIKERLFEEEQSDTDESSFDSDDDPSSMQQRQLQQRQKVTSAFQKQQDWQHQQKQMQKSKFMPVLTTYDVNIKLMSPKIINALGHTNFFFHKLSVKVADVTVSSLKDHDKLKMLFKEHKINYFTYTPKCVKPYLVFIRGLPDGYDANEVTEALNGLGLQIKILGVSNIGYAHWLIKLTKDSDLAAIYAIKIIMNFVVRIERFQKNFPTQCFRCQRFGHIAKNCNMPDRCVKCAGSHESAKCHIQKKNENAAQMNVNVKIGQTVRCANCHKNGHTAGAIICPKKMALTAKIHSKRIAGTLSL